MLAIALGLSSSLCWGLADFLGGLQSRRLGALAVVAGSQFAGLVLVAVVVAASQRAAPTLAALGPAALGGTAGAIALWAFYRALAIGTMSVVAPIAATGAAIPVLVGLARGERPGAPQAIGMAAAALGVVLASRQLEDDAERRATGRRSIVLALVAAAGFGAFFVGLQASARADVLWTLLTARVTSVAPLLGLLALQRSARIPLVRSNLARLFVIGALDISANGLFAAATTQGLLSVVAILGALYPVATVLLARLVLGERVRRAQELGIVAALAGVALIAAG